MSVHPTSCPPSTIRLSVCLSEFMHLFIYLTPSLVICACLSVCQPVWSTCISFSPSSVSEPLLQHSGVLRVRASADSAEVAQGPGQVLDQRAAESTHFLPRTGSDAATRSLEQHRPRPAQSPRRGQVWRARIAPRGRAWGSGNASLVRERCEMPPALRELAIRPPQSPWSRGLARSHAEDWGLMTPLRFCAHTAVQLLGPARGHFLTCPRGSSGAGTGP